MKWLKKGKLVWHVLNEINGDLKTIVKIKEIHVNSVSFEGGGTSFKEILRLKQIDRWVSIDQYKPEFEGEMLFLNDRLDWIIGWYDFDRNNAENENELLEDVTHFMPKLELLINQQNK